VTEETGQEQERSRVVKSALSSAGESEGRERRATGSLQEEAGPKAGQNKGKEEEQHG
jgi:hypothetical protein